MAGWKKKLLIFLSVVLVFGGLVLFDFARSKLFHIDLVEMTPNPAAADGQTPVSVRLRLTDQKGRPVEGHALYALAKNGGMFHSAREITDENGMAEFIYYPYKASAIMELKDAVFSFTDESNSIFIEIGATAEFTLALTEPETKESAGSDILSGIFGE